MFVELDSHDQIVGFIFLPIRDDCFVFFFFKSHCHDLKNNVFCSAELPGYLCSNV